MEMTRERISFTFNPRDMLLSLQMGFSFVRAAVACENLWFLQVLNVYVALWFDHSQSIYHVIIYDAQ